MSCSGEGCPANILQTTPAGTSFLHSCLGFREGSEGDVISMPLKGVAAENRRYACAELIVKHRNPSSVPFSEWCLDEQCFGSTRSRSSSRNLVLLSDEKTFSERQSLPLETEVWICACVWMPLRRQNLS